MMKIDHFRGEYAFLSNFWEVPVTYKGLTYGSNAARQIQKGRQAGTSPSRLGGCEGGHHGGHRPGQVHPE